MRAFAGVVTQQNLLHPFPIWLNFFLVGTRVTPKNIGKIIQNKEESMVVIFFIMITQERKVNSAQEACQCILV